MTDKAPPKYRYQRKTKKELEEIAKGLINGDLFCSDQLPEDDPKLITSVFVSLLFMLKEDETILSRNDIACLYSHKKDRNPLFSGDHPQFLTCHFLDNKDHKRMHKIAEKLLKTIFRGYR